MARTSYGHRTDIVRDIPRTYRGHTTGHRTGIVRTSYTPHGHRTDIVRTYQTDIPNTPLCAERRYREGLSVRKCRFRKARRFWQPISLYFKKLEAILCRISLKLKKKGGFRCACWWTLRKHAHWQAWKPQSNEIVKVLLDLFGLLGSCGAGSYEYNPTLPFKDQMWHLIMMWNLCRLRSQCRDCGSQTWRNVTGLWSLTVREQMVLACAAHPHIHPHVRFGSDWERQKDTHGPICTIWRASQT